MPTNNYDEIKPKKVGHLKGRKCEQRPPERKSTRQKEPSQSLSRI